MSPHLVKPLSFIERKIISKLRLGNLPLRIETARFSRPGIPVNERVCYCGSQEVESEAHLLFKCTKYQHLREAWLNGLQVPDNFLDLDENEKFNLALNKPENINSTARFSVSAMDLRSLANKLY